jgi:hypothetical protein
MFHVLQTVPLSIVVALMASSGSLATPTPRPCAAAVCGAPAPDLGAGAPAIAAVVLSFGVAAWMTVRARRAAQRRD